MYNKAFVIPPNIQQKEIRSQNRTSFLYLLLSVYATCVKTRTAAGCIATALARSPRRNPEGIQVATCKVELGTYCTTLKLCKVLYLYFYDELPNLAAAYNGSVRIFWPHYHKLSRMKLGVYRGRLGI